MVTCAGVADNVVVIYTRRNRKRLRGLQCFSPLFIPRNVVVDIDDLDILEKYRDYFQKPKTSYAQSQYPFDITRIVPEDMLVSSVTHRRTAAN